MTTNTTMKKRRVINRRNLIQGFGLSAGLLPLLSNLPSFAQVNATPRGNKRLIVVWHAHGMHQPSWTTGVGSRAGNNWDFSRVLDPLQPVKAKTNVIEGISGRFAETAERHQRGMVGVLNAADFDKGTTANPSLAAESITMDQMLADAWGTQVLNLGVQVAPRLFNAKSRYENMRISFRGPGAEGAQSADNNPFAAFQRIFGRLGAGNAPPSEQPVAFASNRSVLDALKEEVTSVRARIATTDFRLLEAHTEGIRSLECQLHGVACAAGMMPPVVESAAQCEAPDLLDAPPGNQLQDYLRANDNYPAIAKMQADVAKTAAACGLAPVSVVQFAATESRHTYNWVRNEDGATATSNNHHSMSHAIYRDERSRKDFNAIHRWYSQQVADMASYLDSIPEAGGTALDNTLIYWCTCLGNPGNHYQTNWPSVMVGNLGGYFKTNQSLDFRQGNCHGNPASCRDNHASETTQSDLLNTMAAGLGLGATNDTPVVGNFDNKFRDKPFHANNYFNGLIGDLIA